MGRASVAESVGPEAQSFFFLAGHGEKEEPVSL